MRLLQFAYSPYAAKVRLYLAAKKLSCQIVDVPYLDRREVVSATGKLVVPVLIDGETVIDDSPQIAAYLDQKYAPSFRENPLGIIIEQWADSHFEEVAFRLACPGLELCVGRSNPEREKEARALFRLVKERRYGSGCIDAWKRDEALYSEQVVTLLAPLAQALESRSHILGESFSLADAAVGGQLHMVESALPGWLAAKMPVIDRWYQRIKA